MVTEMLPASVKLEANCKNFRMNRFSLILFGYFLAQGSLYLLNSINPADSNIRADSFSNGQPPGLPSGPNAIPPRAMKRPLTSTNWNYMLLQESLGASLGDIQFIKDVGPVRPDRFTKLLIYTKHVPTNRSGNAAIKQALVLMDRSHCAIRAVAMVLKDPFDFNGISFGETKDEHAEYHDEAVYSSFGTDRWTAKNYPNLLKFKHTVIYEAKTIVINKNVPYMYDTGNLENILYHEGLHHVEVTRLRNLPADDDYMSEKAIGKRCNQFEDGLLHHNPKCVRRILEAILPPGDSCLNQVKEDGTLLNPDGTLYEPNFAKIAAEGVHDPSNSIISPKIAIPLDLMLQHLNLPSDPKKLKFDNQ